MENLKRMKRKQSVPKDSNICSEMCKRISLYTEASINTACSSEEFVLVAKIVSVDGDEDFFLEL